MGLDERFSEWQCLTHRLSMGEFMRVLRRIAYWFRRSEHGRDVADEMAFHRAMIEDQLKRRGLSPAEARDAARRTMGNETYMREESRGVWLWPALDAAW